MSAHGRYTVLRKIADGGTAEVFLAQMEGSAGFKRLVVLKRVRPDLWANEMFRKSLLDEAHIMMGLHHGNIVQVLDVGAAANRYFLAFELVDGWTLAQVLIRAKSARLELPLSLALHVMAQVCRALAYAHGHRANGVSLKIVHRDVSPQNVLLSEQGEVKLADFGIARARTRMTTSQVGSVKGKPAFMSPEQVSGLELDGRSDLFPIGTMLYHLVTGELPFKAKTGAEEMVLIVKGKYVSPEKKRPDLPKELVALIRRALEGDREKRFQSADELLLEIERVQRSVLEVTGQTELKAWLASLAAKDGARPLSRAGEEVTKPPGWDAAAPVIELKDEDVEIITPPPAEAPPPPPGQPRPARRWPMVAVVAFLLAGVVALVAPRYSPAPPPVVKQPIEVAAAPVVEPAAGALEVEPSTATDAGGAEVSEVQPEPPAPTPEALAEVAAVATPGAMPEAQPAADVPIDAGVETVVASSAPVQTPDTAALVKTADSTVAVKTPDTAAPVKTPDSTVAVKRSDTDALVKAADSTVAVKTPDTAAPVKTSDSTVAVRRSDTAAPVKKPDTVVAVKKADTAVPALPPPSIPLSPPSPTIATDVNVSVLMETVPPGAELRIGKRVFGKTPIPIRLNIGITFELVFSKKGFKEAKVLHTVARKNRQRVHVVLEPTTFR